MATEEDLFKKMSEVTAAAVTETAAALEANGTRRQKLRKYLAFTLGDERFAVPLLQVKEVIGLTRITPVPHVPTYFKGLINLRGKIISTIDLREKLSFVAKAAVKRPCIVISEIQGVTIGSIVDDIVEVVGLDEAQIERSLNIQSKVSQEFISGVTRMPGKPLTLILDLGKVLNVEEIAQLKNSSSQKSVA